MRSSAIGQRVFSRFAAGSVKRGAGLGDDFFETQILTFHWKARANVRGMHGKVPRSTLTRPAATRHHRPPAQSTPEMRCAWPTVARVLCAESKISGRPHLTDPRDDSATYRPRRWLRACEEPERGLSVVGSDIARLQAISFGRVLDQGTKSHYLGHAHGATYATRVESRVPRPNTSDLEARGLRRRW